MAASRLGTRTSARAHRRVVQQADGVVGAGVTPELAVGAVARLVHS